MGSDHKQVSFSVRIVSAKFNAISSPFDSNREVVCNLRKIECFSRKIPIAMILGSLERSRRADHLYLLASHDPTIINPSSGPFLHRTHLNANLSFSLLFFFNPSLTLIISFLSLQ